MDTVPAKEEAQTGEASPHLIVKPFYKDKATGATFVHKDLVPVQAAWAEEEHKSPVNVEERFGDVESWCQYVKAHGEMDTEFLTWNKHGLLAILDYPDRRTWIAKHPFQATPQMAAWNSIATDHAVDHRRFIEFLEDHAPDIYEPEPTELMLVLRTLKASSNATFESNPKADGTADIRFSKTTGVASGQQALELPPEITILIPVLRGHVDQSGAVVRYKLVCKLRASVGTDAHLALRLSMPQAEAVMEEVYSERVAAAKTLLGASVLFRAAD